MCWVDISLLHQSINVLIVIACFSFNYVRRESDVCVVSIHNKALNNLLKKKKKKKKKEKAHD